MPVRLWTVPQLVRRRNEPDGAEKLLFRRAIAVAAATLSQRRRRAFLTIYQPPNGDMRRGITRGENPFRVESAFMVALRKRGTIAAAKDFRIPPVIPEDRARQRLRAAAASLGVTLAAEEDSDLVAEAAAAIVDKLAARAAADRTSDDVIFAAGIFTHATVSHFAKSLRTTGDVALIALANFTGTLEEFARVHAAIVEGFKTVSQKQPKLAAEIGEGLTAWLASPGAARFEALIQLFRRTILICRSSPLSVRAMV
jgi:hypothetical protein